MMEEFNIQGKQTSFYKYCPGTFEYTLVYLKLTIPLCPGNDAMSVGNQTPTFRTNTFSTSSRVNTM